MNRLVIVADDVQSAQRIGQGLRHTPNCHVIGYVSGRRPFAMTMRSADPDVALIDDPCGSLDVFERIRETRLGAEGAKIVVLAGEMDNDKLQAVVRAGAHAAISRAIPAASLGMLVREIAEGRVYHAFAPCDMEPEAVGEDPGLTPRELEILRLVAGGASNGQIARDLWVTEQTIKFHLSNTYRKLGVENRTQASHAAYGRGLLDPPHRIDSRRRLDTALAA
jgi:DNA-binding NarL/FixJ family response regulator